MTTRKLNGFRHTDIASAIPDSNKSSRAAWFELADAILLTSLFKLFRSDLYSLSLARSTAFTFGCRLLASRSIFRIWRNMGKAHIQPQKYGEKKKKRIISATSKYSTRESASSNPAFISEICCLFCSANRQEVAQS